MRVLQSVLRQARRSMSPEDEEDERSRLQQVMHKAKDLGRTRMTKEEKERAIQGCEISGHSLTTFQKGVKLGKQLFQLQDRTVLEGDGRVLGRDRPVHRTFRFQGNCGCACRSAGARRGVPDASLGLALRRWHPETGWATRRGLTR